MLDPDLRRTVDALWDKFWAGGLANPLMAIDQMNYLIFLKRLEEADDRRAQQFRAQGKVPRSIFDGSEECRWSNWRNLRAGDMYAHVQSVVFPWLKSLASEDRVFIGSMRDAA